MKSYLAGALETRKFVMAILHWKQELLCDRIISSTFESVFRVAFLTCSGSKKTNAASYPGPCVVSAAEGFAAISDAKHPPIQVISAVEA